MINQYFCLLGHYPNSKFIDCTPLFNSKINNLFTHHTNQKLILKINSNATTINESSKKKPVFCELSQIIVSIISIDDDDNNHHGDFG